MNQNILKWEHSWLERFFQTLCNSNQKPKSTLEFSGDKSLDSGTPEELRSWPCLWNTKEGFLNLFRKIWRKTMTTVLFQDLVLPDVLVCQACLQKNLKLGSICFLFAPSFTLSFLIPICFQFSRHVWQTAKKFQTQVSLTSTTPFPNLPPLPHSFLWQGGLFLTFNHDHFASLQNP